MKNYTLNNFTIPFSSTLSSEELIALDKYVERRKDSLTNDKAVF